MRFVLIGMAVTVAAFVGPVAAATDVPGDAAAHGKMAEWTDSLFREPYVDVDEWRDTPVRHRYVHGGFKGTDARFSIYFPPKEQYQGRFFQPAAVFAGNEYAAQQPPPQTTGPVTQENNNIGFAMASGAYYVETNNGYREAIYQSQDPTISSVIGYRADAAAAQYSRVLAVQMYGPHRPYGYRYGGSGGSLKTVCGIENTWGVWDGVVPYVYGTDMNMPNAFTVQAYAHRILKDKWGNIVDALEPGGSGDVYASLNKEEREAFDEVTRYGFPPRTWFAYDRLGYGPLAWLIDIMVERDPQYFEDFWKVPGYLGANPPESLRGARIQKKTTITRVIMSDEARRMGLPLPPMARGEGGAAIIPAAIQVHDLPSGDLLGSSIIFRTGTAAGKSLSIFSAKDGLISLGIAQDTYAVVKGIRAGDQVQIDNSIFLAAQTYHRHQVPSSSYYVWDQFRKPDGSPLYPQRPRILGPDYNKGNAGCMFHTGWFSGKMIMVETLMDEYAYPWQADWYRNKVRDVQGSRLDDMFRVWFIDNAMHGSPRPGSDNARIVAYSNALQQALRDLSLWVEKGIAPPQSTTYKVVDGQVQVPATATERKGIQPVITLTANGAARADVTVGQAVRFEGVIDVPPATGKVVEAEWDFEGKGDYPVPGDVKAEGSGERATVSTTYSFSKAGTYFPALRAASQRQPDGTRYARIENLARVRIVVKQ